MRKRIVAILLLVAQLMILAACATDGSGTQDTDSSEPSLTVPDTSSPTDTAQSILPAQTTGETTQKEADTTMPEIPEFKPTIAGLPLEDYRIVISTTCEPEEGKDLSDYFNELLTDKYGIALSVTADTTPSADNEIVIGPTTRPLSYSMKDSMTDPFAYKMQMLDGKLYIIGGGCFALRYCLRYIVNELFSNEKSVDADFELSGSMRGAFLYDYTPGSDLRLMSNNSWNRDSNSAEWEAIGEDCSAAARAPGLAAVYAAYHPDVICFQEMTALMIVLIRKHLKEAGYNYSLITYENKLNGKPYTCIIYRSDRLELIERYHYDFAYGNDSNSKGYTWALFEVKETGKRFVTLSTHLWWKSETAEPGSDEMRRRQAAEIVAETDRLEKLYDCPIFVMGDFNTRTTSTAFAEFMGGGFSDCFDLATVYADDFNGHHSCNTATFARETKLLPYKANAIDHIILRNASDTTVLRFDHSRPYFFIKLSDHYPLYVDVKLG